MALRHQCPTGYRLPIEAKVPNAGMADKASARQCAFRPWRITTAKGILMSFLYSHGEFRMITARDSDHGRLMAKTGRASMTIDHDDVTSRSVEQWNVTAEGP